MKEIDNEKLKASIAKYKETGSQDSKDEIFETVRPLIEAIARQRRKNLSDDLDLIQDAAEGFCIALENFDPSRGVKFTTYMYPYLHKYLNENHLQFGIQASNADISESIRIGKALDQDKKPKRPKDKNTLRIFERVREDMKRNGGKLITVGYLYSGDEAKPSTPELAAEDKNLRNFEDTFYLEQLIKLANLTGQETKVLSLVYLEGYTIKQISGRLKLRQDSLKEILQAALVKVQMASIQDS